MSRKIFWASNSQFFTILQDKTVSDGCIPFWTDIYFVQLSRWYQASFDLCTAESRINYHNFTVKFNKNQNCKKYLFFFPHKQKKTFQRPFLSVKTSNTLYYASILPVMWWYIYAEFWFIIPIYFLTLLCGHREYQILVFTLSPSGLHKNSYI